jgi:hypothetical protein
VKPLDRGAADARVQPVHHRLDAGIHQFMVSTGERRRYRVLLVDAAGELIDGYWETDERLEELPDAAAIVYVRDRANKDRHVRARVHHTDPDKALPIAAMEEPRS